MRAIKQHSRRRVRDSVSPCVGGEGEDVIGCDGAGGFQCGELIRAPLSDRRTRVPPIRGSCSSACYNSEAFNGVALVRLIGLD